MPHKLKDVGPRGQWAHANMKGMLFRSNQGSHLVLVWCGDRVWSSYICNGIHVVYMSHKLIDVDCGPEAEGSKCKYGGLFFSAVCNQCSHWVLVWWGNRAWPLHTSKHPHKTTLTFSFITQLQNQKTTWENTLFTVLFLSFPTCPFHNDDSRKSTELVLIFIV